MTRRLAVAVTAKPPQRYEGEARRKAEAWGLPFVARVGALSFERYDAYLARGGLGWALRSEHGELSCSPGIAALRIKRLRSGQGATDTLVGLCELRAGDVVFDGTFGLGADALVCAAAVGASGQVIAAEASFPLYALASEGLAQVGWGESKTAALLAGAAPIVLHHGLALDVLRTQASRSVDCVILDPMFDQPKTATPAFALLRQFAHEVPLDAETLAEARRVARRWVVVKGGRYGRELQRLGLEPLRRTHTSKLVWARIPGSLSPREGRGLG